MGHKRVIVIGSGVSGLGCARELVQRGYQVLVVEARSRVGGRLKGEHLQLQPSPNPVSPTPSAQEQTDPVEAPSTTQPIDLGGALIHGIDDNPIYSITTQMGVPLHEISDYCLLLNESGWPFDPKEDEKITTLFNECLDITFQRAEDDKDSQRTFGDLFDQVCREKGVSPSNPLLKWHQANLELPTGADFHELGYTWNDDEPYGFTGAHAAVSTSWKFVMENLASGLDIILNSPVARIQTVLPDGSTPQAYAVSLKETANPPSADNQVEEPETTAEQNDNSPSESEKEENVKPPLARVAKRPTLRKKIPKREPTSPMRRSRRVRGEDVDVRRSTRSNKGVIQMLQIGHDRGSVCYDDPSKTHSPRKRKRSSIKNRKVAAKASNQDNSKDEDSEEELSEPSSTVQVTLKNGIVLEADAVVCTLPLGVLQLPPEEPDGVQFVPPLPPKKRSAISNLGCGLLNKCAISFPEVFWQDSEFLGMAAKEDSYLVLNAATYTGKPILIFMYGGSFAKKLESWTDSEIVEDCLDVLKSICGKEVPSPVDYCVTRWGKELYSRMAFTYIPPGVNGHDDLSAAGEAIYDPVLPEKPLIMFAGEHTTPYHPSTMHGAFLSGIREAYRYDIFVAPDLNDNIEFTEDNIYERTFQVRRVMKQSKVAKAPKPEVNAAPKSSQIRSRRNRFAGMALRKRPPKPDPAPVASSTPTPSSKKIGSPETPGRRSNRSLAAKKIQEVLSPTEPKDEAQMAEEKKRLQNELEDRILLRSLESYGKDISLIRSQIVPVFGSKRKRSTDQIIKRLQQIAGRKRRSEVWKQWEARKVAPVIDIVDPVLLSMDGKNGKDGKPRRSMRQKAKVVDGEE